jgi:hypothetical protein
MKPATPWQRTSRRIVVPPPPVVPVPGDTVITETAFGQASDPGASAAYSRKDHTHGTPPAPIVAAAADGQIGKHLTGRVNWDKQWGSYIQHAGVAAMARLPFDKDWVCPIPILSETNQFDWINLNIILSGGSGSVRLGIYTVDDDGLPLRLVSTRTTAGFNASLSGIVTTVLMLSGPLALSAGVRYALVIQGQGGFATNCAMAGYSYSDPTWMGLIPPTDGSWVNIGHTVYSRAFTLNMPDPYDGVFDSYAAGAMAFSLQYH